MLVTATHMYSQGAAHEVTMNQPNTPSVQAGPMLPQGSKKQKTAAAAAVDAASLARLPRDVLGSILLGIPASDLRRFRRVCKDWRDTIADPTFIAGHLVHGPRAPTHTIAFYPGRSGETPLNGGGFLFDEHWRLTARFAVDESVDMIGTCKGLLCFRDRLKRVINVVEPFSGESIALPLPSQGAAAGTCSTRAYIFGFDAAARRYKIVYVCFDNAALASATQEQQLQVFTVGADKDWRTVSFSCAVHGLPYELPACGNGGVYWHSRTAEGANKYVTKYVRFDLATENITSVRRQPIHGRMPEGPILCRPARWVVAQCVIGIKWFGEWEDGCWPHDVFVPGPPPDGRRLPGRHALQRGHLLLQEKDGSLRAQTIDGGTMNSLDVWLNNGSKQLIEIGSKDEDPAERYRFVPVHGRHCQRRKELTAIVGRLPQEQCEITTFAYVPTVSPTPFAMYLGMPVEDPCKL